MTLCIYSTLWPRSILSWPNNWLVPAELAHGTWSVLSLAILTSTPLSHPPKCLAQLLKHCRLHHQTTKLCIIPLFHNDPLQYFQWLSVCVLFRHFKEHSMDCWVILCGTATPTQCFLWPVAVIILVAVSLHCCTAFLPSFSSTNTSLWQFQILFSPSPSFSSCYASSSTLFLSQSLLNPFVLHASHSSSVYPSQTALASSGGLYCLHGCAVNIWSPLHCTALLHEPAVWALHYVLN